ncbi:hypothetical protein bcgnr5371_60300 [Bacillus cereus]
MKISEVLSMTQEKPLSEIAKEHLNFGEKIARQALKNAGAKSQRGKKGWVFEGAEEDLEKSIYDFAELKIIRKDTANVSTKVTKKQRTNKTKNDDTLEVLNKRTEEQKGRKRASFDIDKELLKRLKVKSVLEEKHVYEMVEEAIRAYLNEQN